MRGSWMGAKRLLLGAVCAGLMGLGGTVPAQGAAPEPDLVLIPHLLPAPVPPPDLQDPCGVAVDASGRLHVSSYYRHSVDYFEPRFSSPSQYLGTRLGNLDPLDGPCGLSFDGAGRLYVNNYHRNVERFGLTGGPFESGAAIDSSHPTGVAVNSVSDDVYVDARTYVAGYDSSGAPLLDGGDPLKVGLGSLGDGYGLAVSQFPATRGRLYVPDHSTDTVKVYDPLVDVDDPIQTISGPPGGFDSLRDSAVAVDRVTGEVYVADTLAWPRFTERPEATIYVFDPTGAYKGRLKYSVIDGSPSGLAVDNSAGSSQGHVYVTAGNTVQAAVYGYPPGSATSESGPATLSLGVRAEGSGDGRIRSVPAGIECDSACGAEFLSRSSVSLVATPEQGSAFAGWSGGGCSGTGECAVTMSQARSVSAEFEALPGPFAPAAAGGEVVLSTSRDSTASRSAVAQKGTLRVAVSGWLAPKRLPRRGTAPISVSVGGEISTTDRSLPPQLKSLRIELNRNGHLDSTGLPACDYDAIQPASSSRALAGCRDSLVGQGSFTANITLAGQEPYPTRGRLLVFNGVEKGKPVLYGHIYAPRPFATSFVIPFAIQKLGKGAYGTALDAPLPEAMDAWGRLTSLEMTLSRRYAHRGKRHSFISAGCPAPRGFPSAVFPLARTSFTFQGGKTLRSVLTSDCKARG
jgi:hypothetical protein